LGLTISKQLVEMHGGTIEARSEGLGKGATFTVSLPLRALPARVRRPNPGRALSMGETPLTGKAVLLVEDDSDTQTALAAVLRRAGAQVSTAANSDEALRAYRESPPDILLSDVGLPDCDGYELLGKIRAFEREQQLPETRAVALTAYTREEDRKKAFAAGFSSHLSKPVDADELIEALL